MSSLRVLTVAVMAFVLGACAVADTFDPYSEANVQEQIRVTLTVTPESLEPPGTVVATLTYENLTTRTVVLGSSAGCVSFASVYLDEDRIPFPSTQYACTGAVTYRDLEPGAPLKVQWPLVIGGEDGMDVPAGAYRFVAELNTPGENLERTFVIR